jgi:hypothetical protein
VHEDGFHLPFDRNQHAAKERLPAPPFDVVASTDLLTMRRGHTAGADDRVDQLYVRGSGLNELLAKKNTFPRCLSLLL